MDPSKSADLQAVLHDLMKVAEHVNEGVRTRHVPACGVQGERFPVVAVELLYGGVKETSYVPHVFTKSRHYERRSNWSKMWSIQASLKGSIDIMVSFGFDDGDSMCRHTLTRTRVTQTTARFFVHEGDLSLLGTRPKKKSGMSRRASKVVRLPIP